jgi:hypothetical protein
VFNRIIKILKLFILSAAIKNTYTQNDAASQPNCSFFGRLKMPYIGGLYNPGF